MKMQYAGMGVAELRRMKQLKEESRKVKQLVTGLSFYKVVLHVVIRSMFCGLAVGRNWCGISEAQIRVSERRCCSALRFDRSSQR